MTRLPVVLTALLLAATAPAAPAQVYKWKDANGVTHYGDAPPAKAKATQVRTAPVPKPATAPTSATSAPVAAGAAGAAGAAQADTAGAAAPAADAPPATRCAAARRNLELLQGEAPVGLDTNGDGRSDSTMDDQQRAVQSKLAQAGIDAYCTDPGLAAATRT